MHDQIHQNKTESHIALADALYTSKVVWSWLRYPTSEFPRSPDSPTSTFHLYSLKVTLSVSPPQSTALFSPPSCICGCPCERRYSPALNQIPPLSISDVWVAPKQAPPPPPPMITVHTSYKSLYKTPPTPAMSSHRNSCQLFKAMNREDKYPFSLQWLHHTNKMVNCHKLYHYQAMYQTQRKTRTFSATLFFTALDARRNRLAPVSHSNHYRNFAYFTLLNPILNHLFVRTIPGLYRTYHMTSICGDGQIIDSRHTRTLPGLQLSSLEPITTTHALVHRIGNWSFNIMPY